MASPVTTHNTQTLYIKFKGLMNLSEILKTIKSWLGDEYYTFYERKHNFKTTDSGTETEVEMEAKRKMNEYVRFVHKISLRTFDVKDVEVVKNGQKQQAQEGRLTVELKGTMDLDWQKRFKGNKFLQTLQDFYHKYIIRYEINEVWADELFRKSGELAKTIKTALQMEAA